MQQHLSKNKLKARKFKIKEETLKNNGIAELCDEDLEQVNGGKGFLVKHFSNSSVENEEDIAKGRPTATLNQPEVDTSLWGSGLIQ